MAVPQENVILVSSQAIAQAEEEGEMQLDVIPLPKYKAGQIPPKKFGFIITVAEDPELTAILRPAPGFVDLTKRTATAQTNITFGSQDATHEAAQTVFSYAPDRSDTSVMKELALFSSAQDITQGLREEVPETGEATASSIKDDTSETSDHFVSATEITDDEADKEIVQKQVTVQEGDVFGTDAGEVIEDKKEEGMSDEQKETADMEAKIEQIPEETEAEEQIGQNEISGEQPIGEGIKPEDESPTEVTDEEAVQTGEGKDVQAEEESIGQKSASEEKCLEIGKDELIAETSEFEDQKYIQQDLQHDVEEAVAPADTGSEARAQEMVILEDAKVHKPGKIVFKFYVKFFS